MKEVDAKIAALYGLLKGSSPAGHMGYKCRCGRYATAEVRTSHPVAGQRTYYMCDLCEPERLEFDYLRKTESTDLTNACWTKEDNDWARSVNEALEGICF